MNILITSGGTTEPIDAVRGISNFASGRLGKICAETFLAAGHQVFLLAGKNALLPEPQANLTVITIGDTQMLLETMQKLISQVDVVIHSMAVSDYRPVYMTDLESLPQPLTQEALKAFRPQGQAKKISSKPDYQLILLEKTPKIISMIKKWKPEIQLFGFKLLAGVSTDELLSVAREKLVSNQADYIIANDSEKIQGDAHEAWLVSAHDQEKLLTKQAIAQKILQKVEEAK